MIERGLFTYFYVQDSYLDPHYKATDVEESSNDDEVVERNQARKRRWSEPKKKMEGIEEHGKSDGLEEKINHEEENVTLELEWAATASESLRTIDWILRKKNFTGK